MKEKKKSFKDLNPSIAIVTAMLSGLSSLYFGSNLIPVFIEVTDLVNQGAKIDFTAIKVLILLSVYGVFTCFLTLLFMLSQKRVIDALYEDT